MSKETALALMEKQAQLPIKDAQTLGQQIAALSKTATVLSPVTQVSQIAAKHQVALSVVVIDHTVNSKGQGAECYADRRFCEKDEVCIGKNGLLKIMRAAGIQQVSNTRKDDRSNPYYCHIQMVLGMREWTGEWVQHICSKELDFSDGAPDTIKRDGSVMSHLSEMRRHLASLCETKCLHRGIRQMLSLQQKYPVQQLQTRPFVVPRLVMDLDPSDPADAAALRAMATGAQGAFFGPDQKAPAAITDGTMQPDPDTTVIDAATGEVVEPVKPTDPADFGDLPEPEPEHPEYICGCPCGCQAELTEQVAEMTTQKVGTPRCRVCFPGRAFDFPMHADLPGGKLGIETEKHGVVTVEMVKVWLS